MFSWLKKCWKFLKAEADLHAGPVSTDKQTPHPRQHIIDQIEEVDSEDPRLWEYFTEEETDDTDD